VLEQSINLLNVVARHPGPDTGSMVFSGRLRKA